jgi:hypothetical protein
MPVTLKGGQRPEGEQNKLVTNAHGKPGTGKSTFALTHPSPLFYFNCDRPMGNLLEKLPDSYEVIYEAIPLDVDAITPGLATQYMLKFDALVNQALKRGEGTFVVDGLDIFCEIVKVAKLPKSGGDPIPREYADYNTYFNNHHRRLGTSGLQVCFTAMSKPVWTGAKTETDMMASEGFKWRGRWLTTEVYLFTPENRDTPHASPTETTRGNTHSAWISTSKLNEKLVGAVIPGLTFGLLYRMTFGKAYPGQAQLFSPSKVEAAV